MPPAFPPALRGAFLICRTATKREREGRKPITGNMQEIREKLKDIQPDGFLITQKECVSSLSSSSLKKKKSQYW